MQLLVRIEPGDAAACLLVKIF